jgi:hypothetical protein
LGSFSRAALAWSFFAAAISPLLLVGQRSGVNHVNCLIVVQNEDRLDEAASSAFSPHEPFILVDLSREGTASTRDHHLSFSGQNAVFADVLDIPTISAELHELVMQENRGAVNCHMRLASCVMCTSSGK